MRWGRGAALAAAAGLACASGGHWEKPEATPEQLERDRAECVTEGAVRRDVGGMRPGATEEGVGSFRDCMERRGWIWVEDE